MSVNACSRQLPMCNLLVGREGWDLLPVSGSKTTSISPTLLGIGEIIQRCKRIIDSRYAARSVQVVLPRKEQRSDIRRLPEYRDRSRAYISAMA